MKTRVEALTQRVEDLEKELQLILKREDEITVILRQHPSEYSALRNELQDLAHRMSRARSEKTRLDRELQELQQPTN